MKISILKHYLEGHNYESYESRSLFSFVEVYRKIYTQ